MKDKFIFITGGARSGKSRFAAGMAKKAGKNIVFIATCAPLDIEMKDRVKRHKISRPKGWKTVEEPEKLVVALKNVPGGTDAVIIDCLTLYITNLLMAGKNEKTILKEAEKLALAAKKAAVQVILVSNEVGSGIVPENKLARDFRDIAGRANQIMANASDEAYAMISGFPVTLKRS